MANGYAKYTGLGGGGGGVTSLNGETGAVTLVAGTGISITPAGSNITIANTGATGTVTSVGLADSTGLFTITGSPVTTSGTLTLSAFQSQAQSSVLIGPVSGGPGAPTFRLLAVGDIPILPYISTTLGSTALSGGMTVSGNTLSMSQSSTTLNGWLSSTDWNTFNNKQASGNYITALTGQVTASGPGAAAATIATNTVTNSNLAQMSSDTIKGNDTGSLANASDLTVAQVNAILPVFTASLNGLAPLSGGGSTNYLRADGTWAAPPGATSGTVTSVSVTSANGLAGTVATATTTPAITLSTTVNSPILAGDGTGISAATTTGTGSTAVLSTGPTITSLSAGSTQISAVLDPTSAQQAATKNYVDAAVAALNPQAAVYAATAGSNIVGTYAPVGAGIGDTFTTTATTTFTVDGTTPPVASRILIKDQSSGYQNGIYTITAAAVPGVSGTVFTRALDYDTPSDMNTAGLIPVINGTLNALSSWQQTATIVSIGPSGTALVFQEFTANPSLYLLKANNLSDVASATTSFRNISPLTTAGDIIYENATPAPTRLPIGSTGNILTVSGGLPTWAPPSSTGTVTSVAATVPSFLSISGSPITTSGTLGFTYSGTALPVANGGTGATSVTTTPTASTYAAWDANDNFFANSFIPSSATTVTAVGITTLTVSSAEIQYFTGTHSQTLVLPVASTLSNGQQFTIINQSTGSILVNTSGSNTLVTVLANAQSTVTVANNAGGTGTASWSYNLLPITNDQLFVTLDNAQTIGGTKTFSTPPTFASLTTLGVLLNSGAGVVSSSAGPLAVTNGGTGSGSVVSAPAATAWAGWDSHKNMSANSFIEGYTTTATAAGTTAITVSSTQVQFFTGTTTQVVTLPVVSGLVLGQSYTIVNNSTGVVTVESSGGNTILAQPAATTAVYTCILITGTTAASWASSYYNNAGGTSATYTAPLITLHTSGSGTHTFTGSPLYVEVIMVGGGGGGGGSGTSGGGTGGTGGNSSFGTSLLTANGGTGGVSGGAGGTGGSASLGSGPTGIANSGASGSYGMADAGSVLLSGETGASTPLGGGGSGGQTNGGGGIANTGVGGGGAGGSGAANLNTGAAGAAGGYVNAFISGSTLSGLSGSASWAVGAAGSAGGAGASGAAGGAGGSGIVIVKEYYQ